MLQLCYMDHNYGECLICTQFSYTRMLVKDSYSHISLKSFNAAILGDLGCFPMKIFAMKRCLKYWLRILKLREDRYVKLCYNMLVLYDNHGYVNWVTYTRKKIYSNGFGYVWEAQNVDNETLF